MTSERMLEICAGLAAANDYDDLLDSLMKEAMDITRADGGTLYVKEGNSLAFYIMRNNSLGVYRRRCDGSLSDIPSVPLRESYVCSYSVLRRETVNIEDVYESELFDFTGPKDYDKLIGYRTKSMLVVPLFDNEGRDIGTMQLINAKDADGNTVPFRKEPVHIIVSLAAFTAVALSNMRNRQESKRLMFSLFNVIISAVEERTPYNASHTRRIVEMLLSLLDYINSNDGAMAVTGPFDDMRYESMVMCAWLHDIGKLVTPLSIMNKRTRLGDAEDGVFERLQTIRLLARLDFLEGRTDERECERVTRESLEAEAMIRELNETSFVSDELAAGVRGVAVKTYRDFSGSVRPWLTAGEAEALCIPYGTLTAGERAVMEQHAAITAKLLRKIAFSPRYRNVSAWAGSHHEKLDGSGYPQGLHDTELPVEVRLLTVLDIFEALTTDERPYKRAQSPERSLTILRGMASDNQLDAQLIDIFEESRAWEHPQRMDAYLDRVIGFAGN